MFLKVCSRSVLKPPFVGKLVSYWLGRWRKTITLILLSLLLAFFSSSPAIAAPDRLKAAYLYNFAKLTYWPLHKLSDKDDTLTICTSASDSFTQELTEISRKPVSGHKVQVVALGLGSIPDFCHIVFVDKQHSEAWFKRHQAAYEGQLLVGEIPGFIGKGGVINFFLEGDKLRFEVSIDNAAKRGVQISSRLLRLAKIVGDVK